MELRVEYRTVGSFLSDWMVNISKGGMFVHTRNPIKVGSEVRLVFSLPGMPFPFDLNGRVKWIQPAAEGEDGDPPGMGIEFMDLDDRVRKRIERYVSKLQDDVPAAIRDDQPPRVRSGQDLLSGSNARREVVTEPRGRVYRPGRRPTTSSDEES